MSIPGSFHSQTRIITGPEPNLKEITPQAQLLPQPQNVNQLMHDHDATRVAKIEGLFCYDILIFLNTRSMHSKLREEIHSSPIKRQRE